MISIRRIMDMNELLAWREEVILNVFGIEPDKELIHKNEDYYRRHVEAGTHMAFIAEKDGTEAGCGSICFTEELPSPDNPSGMCGYLMNIYVRDKYREHGIGHEIVKHLLEEAKNKGCGKIYLETTAIGRSLYESLGFHDLPDMMKLS